MPSLLGGAHAPPRGTGITSMPGFAARSDMPLIWAAISGHGYGHAAQVVPVLNELSQRVPDLSVLLRTTVPEAFFRDRLAPPWMRQPVQQDVGCIQRGPLFIDVPATLEAHRRFHEQWDERVLNETAAMRTARPSVVLADTPYLSIWAASQAGIPAVGLANFTWNDILAPLADAEAQELRPLLDVMARSYAAADCGLRIAPGLALGAFREIADIGPIADPAPSRRSDLRAQLNAAEDDCLVLIGFGGIPLAALPWEAMSRMEGYRFIVDSEIPRSYANIVSLASLPFRFKTVLASVEVVMTKPGYGTVIESIAAGIAVLYVRRFNFADEAPLVNFLHQHGRGRELSLMDFEEGQWVKALEAVRRAPVPHAPPACTGTEDAAAALAKYLR